MGGIVTNPMIFKQLALTIPRLVSPRVMLLACLVVALCGCSTAPKKTEPKELAKLSLDSQEEAQKLRDSGNLQAAAAKYQEALRYHPSPSVHYELGDVLEKLGRNSEAKAQYDLALARNPNMPEATQALERLNAKVELADRSMKGGPAAPLPASASREQKPPAASASSGQRQTPPAASAPPEQVPAGEPSQTVEATPKQETPPPPEEQVDVFDEDRKFREMSELQPPAPSSGEDRTLLESPAPHISPKEDSESLMTDTEEIYAGRGTEEVHSEPEEAGPEAASWEPTENEPVPTSVQVNPKPSSDTITEHTAEVNSKRTVVANPPKVKPLKGGRGLLNSLDSPPEITTAIYRLPSQEAAQTNSEQIFMQAFDTELASPDESGTKVLVAETTNRPGERGLGSRKRLPPEAPVTVDYGAKTRQAGTTKPAPSTQGSSPKTSTPEAKTKSTSTATTTSDSTAPTQEKKGFFDRMFGEDEITYPEPPTPEAEKSLPSPYGREREELDLRPFHAERLKGKRKVEYEIQTCKDRYYKNKDLEGAIRCLNDKKIDFPENPEIYYELGLILEDAGDYSLARKNLELAIRYDPNNVEYKKAAARLDVSRAKDMRVNGDYAGAQSLLRKTVERYPDLVEAHRELGMVYSADALAKERGLELGTAATPNLEEIVKKTWLYAEEAYQEVITLTEGDYKDWYNLGVAIQKQNRDDKHAAAIKAYEKCILLNPEYANAHYHLGILYESSNVSAAIKHYEIALSQARRMPKGEGQDLVIKCLGSLGELNWRTGNKEKAAEYLTEYIQYAPGDAYIEQMLNQITSEPTTEG